jgi:hypothetical protein
MIVSMPESLTRRVSLLDWLAPFARAEPGSRGGAPQPIGPPLVAHIVSLALVAAVYAVLARGQWFFYDEWDILDPSKVWDVLAPHNGHLSLGLVVVTAVINSVVGLHLYWPYLAVTIVIHLVIVHLVWRVMMRSGVLPSVAILVSLVFALLGVGAENTLWAFQTGFIAPIALGLFAFELLDRPRPTRRRVIVAAVVLGVGILFSSTALPFFAIGLLIILLRRGWLTALVVAVALGVPYLAWRLMYVRGAQPTDAFAAHGAADYLGRVPGFLVTSLVSSLGAVGPVPVLAGAIFVLFLVWVAVQVARTRVRDLPLPFLLLLVGVSFGLLVAASRLHIGGDGSPGRYVYVYVAVAAPAFGMAITWLIQRSQLVLLLVSVSLLALVAFNGVALAINARSQASGEQFTQQSVSAAMQLLKQGLISSGDTPMPELAPQLSAGELKRLVDAGELTIHPYSLSAMLSDLVNLQLTTHQLGGSPALTDCTPQQDGFTLAPGSQHRVELRANQAETVSITVVRGDARSAYTQVKLQPGVQVLVGFDNDTIILSPPTVGAICIPPVSR